jgi:hypothetical protein
MQGGGSEARVEVIEESGNVEEENGTNAAVMDRLMSFVMQGESGVRG